MSNLYQRLIIGSLASLVSILIIWFSPYPLFSPFFALLIATFIALSAAELYSIAQSKNTQPLVGVGILGCFAYAIAIYLAAHYPQAADLPYAVIIATLIGSFLFFFKSGQEPLTNLSITLFALIYIAIPLSSWISIAYFFPQGAHQEGRWWLFYLLAVTKFTDIGAYFVGSALGKNKLSPYISPGKSWEGALGGLIFGGAASFIFYLLSGTIPLSISLYASIWLGVVLSTMGQIGDLAESLLKRDAGVKNSSRIPGLGGILDMLDSLVFTSPILYIFLKGSLS